MLRCITGTAVIAQQTTRVYLFTILCLLNSSFFSTLYKMPPPSQSRKFMYPEHSIPYTVYLEPEDPDEVFQKLDKPESPELQPRPTFLKVGALSQVKGSAYLEYGKTKVMASVHPPREIGKQTKKGALGKIVCSLKYAPFASRDQTQNIARKESFLSMALKKALEPVICRHEFPNFQLDINVYVLDDDGCALSTAINCCGAALAEGGIPTYDLITASTVCLYRNVEFINPSGTVERLLSKITTEAAEEEHGIVVTASLSAVGQVAQCFQRGYMSQERMQRLTENSLAINQRMLDTIKHVLVNKVKKHLSEAAETQS